MISVEKAVQIVLDTMNVSVPVSVPLLKARGQILSEDIISKEDLPSFDYATQTGYALRAADTAKASSGSPVTIHLDGDLLPGQRMEESLKPKHTVRINMGATLPEEADTVLPEEFAVRQSNKKLVIYRTAKAGSNIRLKGDDIPKDSLVMPKGKKLTAIDIGILAALGLSHVKCNKVPRVAFITTGNSVTEKSNNNNSGITTSSNRYILYSQLAEYGVKPVDLGLLNHDRDVIKDKIAEGLKADMFISLVGHSFEDFTFIKRILEQYGMDIKFWKVAIKPATPVIFGTCDNKPVFGISGNPFSFFLLLEQFIRPALMKMMGSQIIKRTEVKASLTKDIRSENGVTSYMRGTVVIKENGFEVTPDFKKSSSIRGFSSTNGLIVIPSHSDYLKAGTKVAVQIITEPNNSH